MVALAATGALVVGGGAAAAVGTGSAEPLDAVAGAALATTYVEPDLAPFERGDVRGAGVVEVSDEFGAPEGGGEAALRLTTPGSSDKAAIFVREEPPSALTAWIPTAGYSAYRSTGGDPVQFPSLQLSIDFDPTSDAGFSTLTYEPVYNPGDGTAPGEWHRYEAGTGNWCSTREIPGVITDAQRSCSSGGAKPLADYIEAQPGIVVEALVLNQGSGNPGQDGAVDRVSTPSTTYDFELVRPEVVPGTDECETPLPEVPEVPELPELPEGEHGGGQENGGSEHEGGQDDGGHQNGAHQNGGHDGGEDDGGHEEPEPQPEPCS